MENLREAVESDLSFTLEGEWGLPVELIDPDGKEYTTSANSPDPENPLHLMGQVLLLTRDMDPDTGMPIVVGFPHVVLRISSLERVPVAGERWAVKIPLTPSTTAPLVTLFTSEVNPVESNGSIGFVQLNLQKVIQKP